MYVVDDTLISKYYGTDMLRRGTIGGETVTIEAGHITVQAYPAGASDFVSTLSRTLAAANRFLMTRLRDEGLDSLVPSHGDILMYLFVHEDVTMHELALAIGREPSTVTCLVRKLANAGYVQTAKHDGDRRITYASLTERGRRLRGVFDEISTELVATQMTGVSPADFDVTRDTLETMRRNFDSALAVDTSRKGDER